MEEQNIAARKLYSTKYKKSVPFVLFMLIFKLHVNVDRQIHHDVRALNHLLQSWNIDHTLSESPDGDQATISNMAHLSWSIESALNQMLRSRSINIPSLCDSHASSGTSLLSRQHTRKVTLCRSE